MSKFVLSEGEMLQIEVTETEESRVPEIFDALVECSAFVTRGYVTHDQHPGFLLIFL